jgi:hypothetical protein
MMCLSEPLISAVAKWKQLHLNYPLIITRRGIPEATMSSGEGVVWSNTPWSESASEQYRPSDRRLSAKLVVTFTGRVGDGKNYSFLQNSTLNNHIQKMNEFNGLACLHFTTNETNIEFLDF